MLYDPGRYETVFYPALQTPNVRIATTVIARHAVAPVTASHAITPVTASHAIAPVIASHAIAPVIASHAIEPVTASHAIAPVIARSEATWRSLNAGSSANRNQVATPSGLAMTVVVAP